ncbi:VOC family protein [Phaeobacter sp. 11ANDIMAR09]|uniref:VOC family protein n=1 Tax=Phaeobacter sp. 11ANDIMAR09 TaxID=1225647 RepID=UPI0009FA71FA|nr:VOC family protein [Phaeobacter sp. 11ANDIMAR09]
MQHLALVAIVVPDYDAGIAFYVGKLGFDLLEDTDLGHGKRWVRVGPKGAQTDLVSNAQTKLNDPHRFYLKSSWFR